MNHLMRRTKMKGWYEFYRVTCPICGKSGGCMQHENGEVIACIRIESERNFSKGKGMDSYLHYLKGDKKQNKITHSEAIAYEGEPKQIDKVLNMVYSEMMKHLTLSEEHYLHLKNERKLSDDQIKIRGYRSFPDKPWEIAKKIQDALGVIDLTGIPGFYEAEGKSGSYWTIAGGSGILIPFRNERNLITGFQYRVKNPPNEVHVKLRKSGWLARVLKQPNLLQVSFEGEILWEKELELGKTETVNYEGEILGWVTLKKGNRYFWLSSANKQKGTGSGNPAPIHISVPSKQLKTWEAGELHKAKSVWIGEGPLKGDITVDLIEELYDPLELEDIGTTLISLPGVGSWRLILPVIKALEVLQVNICFDADAATNPDVQKHLIECVKELKTLSLRGNLIIWNSADSKGIDDLLLKRTKLPQIKKIF